MIGNGEARGMGESGGGYSLASGCGLDGRMRLRRQASRLTRHEGGYEVHFVFFQERDLLAGGE